MTFSGSRFRLPMLLRVSDNSVEPLPESEYSAPLRFQLANFAPHDRFIWVDRCYKMARLWQPSLALSPPTGASHKGSSVVNPQYSMSTNPNGTAKPRPCSPAHAASTAAFSARIFV